MATRQYVTPVGVDLRSIGTQWQIAGISVDNPSGSWLNIPNIGAIPPYTMGWAASATPTILNIDVLFTASPSGTPSTNIGGPVTVTLSSVPIAASAGTASGASEIQQSGIGAITRRFSSFSLNETYQVAAAIITPSANVRIVPVRWRVNPLLQSNRYIRTIVKIRMVDGGGANVFPDVSISPEYPDSGYMPPVAGYYIGPGGALEIGGLVGAGGGAVDVTSYLEYYAVVM